MPHIVIKMHPGRTKEQKDEMVKRLSKEMVELFGCKDEVISVSYEEVASDEWKEKVYDKDIKGKEDSLWKKPGYKM